MTPRRGRNRAPFKEPSLLPYFIFLCLTASLPASAFGQAYTITDLGDFGGYYSEAHGISASGSVVGEFEPVGFPYQEAFYYHNGTNEELGVAGAYVGEVRVAGGIDDHVATPAPAAGFVLEHREEQ